MKSASFWITKLDTSSAISSSNPYNYSALLNINKQDDCLSIGIPSFTSFQVNGNKPMSNFGLVRYQLVQHVIVDVTCVPSE